MGNTLCLRGAKPAHLTGLLAQLSNLFNFHQSSLNRKPQVLVYPAPPTEISHWQLHLFKPIQPKQHLGVVLTEELWLYGCRRVIHLASLDAVLQVRCLCLASAEEGNGILTVTHAGQQNSIFYVAIERYI